MNSKSLRGFTLIEVLVALAIVIIAFMAMYGAMLQVVAATTLMQEKTLATWIAFDRITELRVAGTVSADNDSITDTVEMAGSEWRYTVTYLDIERPNVKRVIVRVSPELDPDNIMGVATGFIVNRVPATGPNNPNPNGPNGPNDPNNGGNTS